MKHVHLCYYSLDFSPLTQADCHNWPYYIGDSADVWSDSDRLPVCSPAGQISGSHDESGLNQQLTRLIMITDKVLNTVSVFSIQEVHTWRVMVYTTMIEPASPSARFTSVFLTGDVDHLYINYI